MHASTTSRRHQQLTSVWTNLRALLHWWAEYSAALERARTDVDAMALERAGWYFSALILQQTRYSSAGGPAASNPVLLYGLLLSSAMMISGRTWKRHSELPRPGAAGR